MEAEKHAFGLSYGSDDAGPLPRADTVATSDLAFGRFCWKPLMFNRISLLFFSFCALTNAVLFLFTHSFDINRVLEFGSPLLASGGQVCS